MIGHKERKIGALDLNVKPINNKVVLRVWDDPTKWEGLIKGSSYWEESSHLVRYGEIVGVCDKLYEREVDGFGIEWGTRLEVEVGDVVYTTKMASYNAPSFEKDGQFYWIVDYSELVLRIRDGVIYPLNGYVLLDKKDEQAQSTILNLDCTKHQNKKQGIVRYVGEKLSYYFPKTLGLKDDDLEVGSNVLFALSGFTFLEDDRYAKLDKSLGYIQRRWIIAEL